MGIISKVIRTSVIAGVVGGVVVAGTIMVAGPQRSAAIFHQLREDVIQRIDCKLEDPVAMRQQLRELAQEYPEKISALRGDLAELQTQIRQLDRDRAVSQRVVALASRDIESLQPLLAAASATGNGRLAAVRTEGDYAIEQTKARARRIRQTQAAYSNRASEAAHDLMYLRQQEERMEDILIELQGEYEQFQTQLTQLERQVDAIERNERLISLLERRQRRIDEMSRFEASSLEHVVARLAELRSRQEAELQILASDQRRVDYESMARQELDQESQAQRDLNGTFEGEAVQQFPAVVVR
jgi:chromosome segregation ATPase